MEPPVESTGGSLPSASGPDPIDRWVRILENLVRIPFTDIRFGLDVMLGFFPVIGDFAGLLCGFPLLLAALRRRLPPVVILVMTANVLLDAVMGSVPVLGDVFDIAWKSHQKNLRLLRDPEALTEVLREARWKLGALVGIVVLLGVLLFGLLVFAIRMLWIASEWSWAF